MLMTNNPSQTPFQDEVEKIKNYRLQDWVTHAHPGNVKAAKIVRELEESLLIDIFILSAEYIEAKDKALEKH